VASIPQSVDGLVMVLLGGLQTLSGPLVGAFVYHGLQTEIMRATDYWRVVVGAIIILLVVVFPQGIAGFVRARFQREDA
jgi:branched-chain amino acid transport system permease protein